MQNPEQRLSTLIENTVNQLGFELVKVSLHNNPKTFEILIDKLDNQSVSIADCQLVSNNISVLLDVQDAISDKYYLTVSSAGLERPLINFKDYNRFLNRDVKIKLRSAIAERNNYYGTIIKAEDNVIILNCEDKNIEIQFDAIKSANLVFTDSMFRKLLNK